MSTSETTLPLLGPVTRNQPGNWSELDWRAYITHTRIAEAQRAANEADIHEALARNHALQAALNRKIAAIELELAGHGR